MNKLIISIIVVSTIAIGIGAFFVFQKPQTELSTLPKQSPQQDIATTTAKSLFGTMLAFNMDEAPRDTPGIIGTLLKGWTEFRKDNSAYQNLKSNLKKLIQDRTKFVMAAGFPIDRGFNYFTWNIIEPKKGQFDWGLTDIYVKGITNAGVKISAVVQPFAGWDQKNTLPLANCNVLDFALYDYKAGPPNDIAEYQNFLTKIVERYKGKVAVWEIGNEYDGHCGGYENNPQGYFDLVKISSETIKKVDPKAIVTNGGASGFANTDDGEKNFWTKFFELGGGQYIDYFNLHYNIERSQSAKLDPVAFEKYLKIYNNLMDKNGGRKPLYLTEFGIYSGAPSEPPSTGKPVQRPDQTQTNLSTQLTPTGQSPNQPPSGGKCGDGICDDFEKSNPNACPQDCGGSAPSGSPGQYQSQSPQGQVPSQNTQPNQGKTLPKLSENAQAALYFKDSILAFANGVKVVFIDLIGDNYIIGSSMAFNIISGQPRLFLTTLKTIDSKIGGFSRAEKITGGQYKFTIGNKTVYALWSGTLPNEISGQVKVTDIKGQEQIIDAAEIKLSADRPVFVELRR